MIRVLLVDDQQLVREGLRRILVPSEGFDIVGECDDGSDVLAAVDSQEPDVVLMDIRMKKVDGIAATQTVRSRSNPPPVLILTTFDDDELLSGALRAGAAGFQLKDASAEDIIRATKAVAAGDAWLDPSVTARVLAAYRKTSLGGVSPGQVDVLTARELDVLQLMARGLSNSEIANELTISEVTVKTHIGHILSKLHLRDRAAAIVFAFDQGIATPQSGAAG
ncbi:MAG TPA: response regulator transcription factor [Actinomycetota bacterium]|nr:response regulator transcription factor [Actinomycetota bacterium]